MGEAGPGRCRPQRAQGMVTEQGGEPAGIPVTQQRLPRTWLVRATNQGAWRNE